MAENPILKFAQDQKSKPVASVTDSTNPILKFQNTLKKTAVAYGSNPILDFANKTGSGQGPSSETLKTALGGDAGSVPATYDDARKLQESNPSVWHRISKQLMKPIGVFATAVEELGGATGGSDFLNRAKNLPKKIGGVITGSRERSFTDIWQENAPKVGLNHTVATIVGLITDIAADPLNFVGGGLTKLGKVADKASELNKIGESIRAGSKLDKEIKALGLTADLLKLAPTKAEQVRQGQRALLTLFSHTSFEKTLIKGPSIYEATNALKTGFKTTRVSQLIQKVFSTKTADEGFNLVKNHFDNLADYRKGEVMNEAVDIQSHIGKLSKEEALRVLDVVESGKKTGVSAIDDIALRLKTNFEGIINKEKDLGLVKTTIQEYFPHIKVKDKESVINRIGRMFYDPKKYSTALGSSKERQILKFASDTGEELVGKAKDLGLKELKDGTFKDKTGKVYNAVVHGNEIPGVDKAGVNEINKMFGTEFFESRPAVAYAQRALASSKAVTSREFFNSVKQFASKEENAIEVTAKDLAGLKFAPDIARQIEDYHRVTKNPDQVNMALKVFDNVQNWWKAQVLAAPSYHIRNMAGNLWNNFLAGITNPAAYFKAGALQSGKPIEFTDDVGRLWNNSSILKAAKQTGVLGDGWYAKDIATGLGDELGGIAFNPLKQNFALFRANRAAGTVVENNARLAHFMERLKAGDTIDNAALSVKKYLFDYGDLTKTERDLFKRAVPFYTWTRKNIPLQFEKLATQPTKFTAVTKATDAIESGVQKPNEKYLGNYIRDNIGVRVGTDKEGNTFYFLMGNWLPAAQAIDFISQPTDNMMAMLTPFVKTPVELWGNKSSFFEDTVGQDQPLERYPEENQSWLGFTMRKKTAFVLKNIRILNELDKLNPGGIFGDDKSPSLANKIAPEVGFRLGKIGEITTSERRKGRNTPETEQGSRVLQSMFGKLVPYNPSLSKQFFLWDTDTKIRELQKSIKDAQRDGQKEYAKRLNEELNKFRKERR